MKNVYSLTMILVFFSLLTFSVSAESYNSFYLQGSEKYTQGEYEDALDSFTYALNISPEMDFLWVAHGNTLFQLHRYEESRDSFNKAITLNPSNTDAWHGLGTSLHALKENKDSLIAFEKAIELSPDYYYAWFGKANVEFDFGDYDSAFADYEKAISIKPSFSAAWAGKGDVFFIERQYEKAVSAYDIALMYDPSDKNTQYDRQNALKYLKLDKYIENPSYYNGSLTESNNSAQILSLFNEAHFPITIFLILQCLVLVFIRALCILLVRFV